MPNSKKPSLADAKKLVENISEEDDRDRLANAALKGEFVKTEIHTRSLREKYSVWVYRYLVGYSVAALAIILMHGFKLGSFQLDPTSLALIVGSTAVSALGLVGIVARGLFPHV